MPARPEPAQVHLLVLAKQPVAGRVKTRLCPPCTPDQAADLAGAALRDTFAAVLATPAASRTVVLDGAPGDWLPAGLGVAAQRGGGLDERLAYAFADAAARAPGPVLLVGMDTPQLDAGLLGAAVQRLVEPGVDAVLGHARDGGWWALGLRRPDGSLLSGIATSTATTGLRQHERLVARGLRVERLPDLTDVDDAGTAAEVARCAPDSQFARSWRELVAA